MEIGILSDVHANATALEKVLFRLKQRNVSEILCAGDLVGYYAQPNRAIRLLEISDAECILGNHDSAVIDSIPSEFNIYAKRAADWTKRNLSTASYEFLSSLPTKRRFTVSNRDICMVHGSPRNPLQEYVFPDEIDKDFLQYHFDNSPDIVVLGHTHQPFIKKVNDTLVINPGSVGQPRDGDPRSSYAVVDLGEMNTDLLRSEYNIDEVYDETLKHLPRKIAERLKKGE